MNTNDTEYPELKKYSEMSGHVSETHLYMT